MQEVVFQTYFVLRQLCHCCSGAHAVVVTSTLLQQDSHIRAFWSELLMLIVAGDQKRTFRSSEGPAGCA
jgi:hypothetical protein